MTFEKFCNTYKIGKSYAYNGGYKGECVTLIKLYIKNVLGVTPQSAGDAKYYWINRNSKYISSLFTPIANTASFVPQKGDVFVRNSGTYGHIGIVISATRDYFNTIEQNYNDCGVVKKIKHTDWKNINFLRPKNQTNINGVNVKFTGKFPTPVKWSNGSTPENVFINDILTEKIGSYGANHSTVCYGKSRGSYAITYKISTGATKAGFVKYAGGVKNAPTDAKTWTNGSTDEIVYADSKKGYKIAICPPRAECYCLGKIDGMYLIVAQSGRFIGFVEYNGRI